MSFNSGAVHFKDISKSSPKGQRSHNSIELNVLLDSKINSFCNICFSSYRTFLYSQGDFGRHIVIALSVRSHHVRCISPIRLEGGITNLVCGCLFGWRSASYHVWVTVTTTSDLVSRIIVSGAYLLYYLR